MVELVWGVDGGSVGAAGSPVGTAGVASGDEEGVVAEEGGEFSWCWAFGWAFGGRFLALGVILVGVLGCLGAIVVGLGNWFFLRRWRWSRKRLAEFEPDLLPCDAGIGHGFDGELWRAGG